MMHEWIINVRFGAIFHGKLSLGGYRLRSQAVDLLVVVTSPQMKAQTLESKENPLFFDTKLNLSHQQICSLGYRVEKL